MKIIILAFLYLLMCSTAHATTYWASTTGGAASCTSASGTSDPKTYRTFVQGVACLSGGDTLMLKSGTYSLGATIVNPPSGTSSNRTIIRSETSRGAIFQNYAFPFDTYSGGWQYVDFIGIVSDGTDNPNDWNNISFGTNGTNPTPATHIRFYDCEIRYARDNGMAGGFNIEFYNGSIHHNGQVFQTIAYAYGWYFGASDSNVLANSEIYSNGGYGLHVNSDATIKPTNNQIYNNYIHDNDVQSGYSGSYAQVIIGSFGSGNVFYNNIVSSGSLHGLQLKAYNTLVYNNTFYGHANGYGIVIDDASDTSIIRNNIFYANLGGIADNGFTNFTQDHNSSNSSDPSFVNAAGGNFSLAPTSNAIDVGVSSIATGVSLSCAGICDLGVYEVPKFNSCSAAGTTLSLVFDNPRFPPMTNLATTGLSLTVDGTSRSLSSPVLIGTNQVNVTFSGASVASTASSTGSTSVVMTDSANIGGSTSNVQKVQNWGSTACTVTPAAGALLAQTHFRFHDLPGTEAAPRCLSASGVCTSQEDVNYTVQKGGCFRLRLKMSCTGGDCAAGGFIARYSKNGGGYTVVPDTFGADNIKLYGTGVNSEVPNQGTQTTELLTSGFATNVTGAVIRTSNAIPNVDLSQNSESELEYVICIDSDETVGTTYDFRLYNQNGTALNTYSVTPRLTIATPRMKGHGLGV